jgi:polyisoprenoid-binding protein YceI
MTMRTRLFRHVTLALAGVSLSAMAVLGSTGVVDPARSQIHFIAQQAGVEMEGSFARFTAQVSFDPAQNGKAQEAKAQDGSVPSGKVHVEVEVGSVDAGGADANAMLKGTEFFDATHFAVASFDATSFQALPDGRFQARGPFTLKGHTAEVVMQFATRQDASGRWFDGSTQLSRLAFGVGQGQWADTSLLDDAVQIRFHLQMKPAAG